MLQTNFETVLHWLIFLIAILIQHSKLRPYILFASNLLGKSWNVKIKLSTNFFFFLATKWSFQLLLLQHYNSKILSMYLWWHFYLKFYWMQLSHKLVLVMTFIFISIFWILIFRDKHWRFSIRNQFQEFAWFVVIWLYNVFDIDPCILKRTWPLICFTRWLLLDL